MNPATLTTCTVCHGTHATTARTCPHCGHLIPRPPVKLGADVKWGIAIGIIAVCVVIGYFILQSSHNAAEDLRKWKRAHDQAADDIRARMR